MTGFCAFMTVQGSPGNSQPELASATLQGQMLKQVQHDIVERSATVLLHDYKLFNPCTAAS